MPSNDEAGVLPSSLRRDPEEANEVLAARPRTVSWEPARGIEGNFRLRLRISKVHGRSNGTQRFAPGVVWDGGGTCPSRRWGGGCRSPCDDPSPFEATILHRYSASTRRVGDRRWS